MREPGVVIGRVVETRPHPHRQRIWLSAVDIGTDCKPQIVWGGMPIVRTGCLVPVAQPGAWLPPTLKKPGWYKIRRRRYAGEISDGMLCSLAELGWDPSVTDWVALLDTSADLRVGRPLEVKAPVEDWQRIALRIDACEAYKLAASAFEDSLCKFLASLVTLASRPLGWDAPLEPAGTPGGQYWESVDRAYSPGWNNSLYQLGPSCPASGHDGRSWATPGSLSRRRSTQGPTTPADGRL